MGVVVFLKKRINIRVYNNEVYLNERGRREFVLGEWSGLCPIGFRYGGQSAGEVCENKGE